MGTKKLKHDKLTLKKIKSEIALNGFIDVYSYNINTKEIGNIVRMVRYHKKTNHLHGFIVNPVIGKEEHYGYWSTDWKSGNGGSKWYRFSNDVKNHEDFSDRV